MALEGMAALNLAANIAQFIDFGCTLFSESRKVYRSSEGNLKEDLELESIANSLSSLTKGLIHKPPQGSPEILDETGLASLAKSCKNIADELLEALNELKVKGSQRKWQSFRIALKRIRGAENIKSLSERLNTSNGSLTSCMVGILR